MPKVSIIIPVYNAENYILQCLTSIEAQRFRDFEVIIIDDGSTDRSSEIANRFIKERNLCNYRLLCQKNQGPSAARNAGLAQALGEWIAFIDGDDWVESDYISDMVETVERNKAELCVTGYQEYNVNTKLFTARNEFPCEYGTLPENLNTLYSYGFVWAHLYKKAILEKYRLRFDEAMRYCEDVAFNLDYNSKIKSFCQSRASMYIYRAYREESLSGRPTHPKKKRKLYGHMQAFCDSFEKEKLIRAQKENVMLSQALWNALSTAVINDILENRFHQAYQKKKTVLAKTIANDYIFRSNKDVVFLTIWKTSFLCLSIIVKIYYGNFEALRNTKILKAISKTKV